MLKRLTTRYRSVIWVLFISALIMLSYGLFRPIPPQELFNHSDKVGHIVAFFFVPLIGRLALTHMPSYGYWTIWMVLAGLLEYLQGVLRPLRIFSAEDAYANLMGVILAMFVYTLLNKLTAPPGKE